MQKKIRSTTCNTYESKKLCLGKKHQNKSSKKKNYSDRCWLGQGMEAQVSHKLTPKSSGCTKQKNRTTCREREIIHSSSSSISLTRKHRRSYYYREKERRGSKLDIAVYQKKRRRVRSLIRVILSLLFPLLLFIELRESHQRKKGKEELKRERYFDLIVKLPEKISGNFTTDGSLLNHY